MSDKARIAKYGTSLYGVQPNIFDAMLSEFLVVAGSNASSGLGLVEQLYTARGS